MTRLLIPFRAIGRILGQVLVPETSQEAVVEVGLVLLAAAFLSAGLVPLAIGVPGGLLVAIGLGFNLRRGT
jgi:hypothetical protein